MFCLCKTTFSSHWPKHAPIDIRQPLPEVYTLYLELCRKIFFIVKSYVKWVDGEFVGNWGYSFWGVFLLDNYLYVSWHQGEVVKFFADILGPIAIWKSYDSSRYRGWK